MLSSAAINAYARRGQNERDHPTASHADRPATRPITPMSVRGPKKSVADTVHGQSQASWAPSIPSPVPRTCRSRKRKGDDAEAYAQVFGYGEVWEVSSPVPLFGTAAPHSWNAAELALAVT